MGRYQYSQFTKKRKGNGWRLGRAAVLWLVLSLVMLVTTAGALSWLGQQDRPATLPRAALSEIWTELQLAVLDRISTGGDAETSARVTARAEDRYRKLTERLASFIARTEEGANRRLLEDARGRLDGYWRGLNQVMALRDRRGRLADETLQPVNFDARSRLQRIKNAGGPAAASAAAIAGDAVISLVLVQQYADRFAGRGNSKDADRARQELEAAERRLAELERLALEPPIRTGLGEVRALLGSYRVGFDQLVAAVAEESTLSASVIGRDGDALKTVLGAASDEPLPEPNHVADYQLPRIVTLAAMIAPVLGLVVGGLVMIRRRQRNRLYERGVTPTAPGNGLDHRAEPASPPASAESAAAATECVAVTALASADWLAGMGRVISAINAPSHELERARQLAEQVQAEQRLIDQARGTLAEAQERAEARCRAMVGFLGELGDLLSGPLVTIVGHGDRLMAALDRQGTAQLTPDVEIIQWSGEQLLRLIEALRDMARLQSDTLVMTAEGFLLDHLITELRERLRPLAGLFGVNLTIESPPAPAGAMHTDFAKLRTALIALLENACKFSENGDVTLAVALFEQDGLPVVRFTVTDNGTGIPAELMPRIFEPFIGFGRGRTRGAGLGLTLVRAYAERLGGAITVDSAPGLGSCFVLTVPAALPQDAEPTSPDRLDQPVAPLTLAAPAENVPSGDAPSGDVPSGDVPSDSAPL